jgi:hypothetical protein
MLKTELETKVEELESQIASQNLIANSKKERALALCKRVLDENCDDSHEYVAELDEVLNLGFKLKGALDMGINLPISLLKQSKDGFNAADVQLTIKGIVVDVEYVNDFDVD